MRSIAVVLKGPEHLVLGPVALTDPTEEDVVVDVDYSGISTGTERLLFTGRMPPFPGMGYPLVPGYESVGRVVDAGRHSGRQIGETVFVPGSRGFQDVRGLFGGAASRLVASGARVVPIDPSLRERGVLVALAATAYHALVAPGSALPDVIVGHGVLGRLAARIVLALGGDPVVWETNPARRGGGAGYAVVDPQDDHRADYGVILDCSGTPDCLDAFIRRIGRGGEIVLAGFYEAPLSFAFPPAFMREARIRVAAEWRPTDLAAVTALIDRAAISLTGLITHRAPAAEAPAAYRTAFGDPACLKMVLDWSQTQ